MISAARGGRPLVQSGQRIERRDAAQQPQPHSYDLHSRVALALQRGIIERENCKRSGLYYLENYVWTYDEHEKEEPKKKLFHGDNVIDPMTLQPIRPLDGREDDFLRYTALVWLQEPLMLVPKSRQLRLSHLMMALHGWLAQFYVGQRIAIQSKKHEDADALLERRHKAMEIERNLYPHVPWPKYRRKNGAIIFEHGSVMMACAQGADVLRSYTFSAIFSDEMAFQDMAEDAYVASIPTIEGGGKFTGVSTANPGYFEEMVFDRLALEI